MKLYDTTSAPNPRRIRLFLAEKGVTLPMEEISIMKGENRTPEYLAKSPMGHVPALELDDGTVISESPAIQGLIEAKHPEPNLLGKDDKERAAIQMWDRRMELYVLNVVATCFRHTHPAMAKIEDQIPAWGESCRERSMKAYKMLNRRLEHSPFIAGERFTVADITTIVALDFGKLAKIYADPSLTHLVAWQKKIAARESVIQYPR